MITITQTDYIDFISKSGKTKFSKVHSIFKRSDYHPAFDYYKKLREEIVENQRLGKGKSDLLKSLLGQIDAKKYSRYNRLVIRFLRFIGRKKVTWFEPPRKEWKYKNLIIRLNPELGLDINGEKYIIKLYFKDIPLLKKEIAIALHMMNDSLSRGIYSGYKCSILDVNRKKLFTYEKMDNTISVLLQAEAEYFINVWEQLNTKSA